MAGAPNSPKQVLFLYSSPQSRHYAYTWSLRVWLGVVLGSIKPCKPTLNLPYTNSFTALRRDIGTFLVGPSGVVLGSIPISAIFPVKGPL